MQNPGSQKSHKILAMAMARIGAALLLILAIAAAETTYNDAPPLYNPVSQVAYTPKHPALCTTLTSSAHQVEASEEAPPLYEAVEEPQSAEDYQGSYEREMRAQELMEPVSLLELDDSEEFQQVRSTVTFISHLFGSLGRQTFSLTTSQYLLVSTSLSPVSLPLSLTV